MSAPDSGSARLAAARQLGAILGARSSDTDEPEAAAPLEGRDQAFARHLVYGVLRWLGALEFLAAQLLRKPLKARDRDVELLILVGLFQLWKGDTAPHAAVHATVQATQELGKGWAAGLVNAVLRNFQRRQAQLLNRLAEAPERHAHPAWLLQTLQSDWPEQWPAIVEANNAAPPLWLRVNRQRIEPSSYAAKAAEAGLIASAHPELPEALRVEPAVPVSGLPGFGDGLVSVQDAAAQWAAHLLDAQPNQRVLDACAAPGGKTGHLLERRPDVKLTALDRDPERVALIRDNLQRLGLDCTLLTADAANPAAWWDGQRFERILLDAPCSATGVIRRHPEIKWLRDPQQVDRAVRQQSVLLDALWPLLEPGGMLVYATCSVLKRENSEQIRAFLSRHADAEPVDPPGRQILPGEQDMDGFYYARLRKPV